MCFHLFVSQILVPDEINIRGSQHQTHTGIAFGRSSLGSAFLSSRAACDTHQRIRTTDLFRELFLWYRYLIVPPVFFCGFPFLFSWLAIFLVSHPCTIWILFSCLTCCSAQLLEKTTVISLLEKLGYLWPLGVLKSRGTSQLRLCLGPEGEFSPLRAECLVLE